MSEECTHECGSCSENCSERDMHKKPHELSNIKRVIGVSERQGRRGQITHDGSVGCYRAAERGCSTAVMDADITGPSIPKMFGISEKASGYGNWAFCP